MKGRVSCYHGNHNWCTVIMRGILSDKCGKALYWSLTENLVHGSWQKSTQECLVRKQTPRLESTARWKQTLNPDWLPMLPDSRTTKICSVWLWPTIFRQRGFAEGAIRIVDLFAVALTRHWSMQTHIKGILQACKQWKCDSKTYTL